MTPPCKEKENKSCLLLLLWSSPAESLRNEFQVVVSGHELSEAGQFAHSWRNPIKVQLVRIYIQLLQFGQLADGRLVGDAKAAIKHCMLL